MSVQRAALTAERSFHSTDDMKTTIMTMTTMGSERPESSANRGLEGATARSCHDTGDVKTTIMTMGTMTANGPNGESQLGWTEESTRVLLLSTDCPRQDNDDNDDDDDDSCGDGQSTRPD